MTCPGCEGKRIEDVLRDPKRGPLSYDFGSVRCLDCGRTEGLATIVMYSGNAALWSDDKATRDAAKADWAAHISPSNPFLKAPTEEGGK